MPIVSSKEIHADCFYTHEMAGTLWPCKSSLPTFVHFWGIKKKIFNVKILCNFYLMSFILLLFLVKWDRFNNSLTRLLSSLFMSQSGHTLKKELSPSICSFPVTDFSAQCSGQTSHCSSADLRYPCSHSHWAWQLGYKHCYGWTSVLYTSLFHL